MPRKPRYLQFTDNLVYHIINRGILSQNIFKDASDFQHFLKIIAKYKKRFLFDLYHWCLVNNHYHLVIKFYNPLHLSKITGGIQQVYVNYYHKKYSTSGHFFQNRFKSQAIESSQYLLSCGRYVELNPVRAKIVNNPWDWNYSSCSFYTHGKKDNITTYDPEWSQKKDKEDYKKWLMEEEAKSEEKIFKSNIEVIGSKEFKANLEKINGRFSYKKTGRPKKV